MGHPFQRLLKSTSFRIDGPWITIVAHIAQGGMADDWWQSAPGKIAAPPGSHNFVSLWLHLLEHDTLKVDSECLIVNASSESMCLQQLVKASAIVVNMSGGQPT